MTVLNVGHIVGLGMGNVPKHPIFMGVSASRNASQVLRIKPARKHVKKPDNSLPGQFQIAQEAV
jgi:hypothetical protein